MQREWLCEPFVHITGERVFVAQASDEGQKLVFDSLDLRSSVSKGTQTVVVSHVGSSAVRYSGTTAWIECWGELYAVDMTTLQVKSTWP